MPKLVMMPPQDEHQRDWAARLADALPHYTVVVPETEDEASQQIGDADCAYGWVPPEMLGRAKNLRWLQSPYTGPPPGYYYQALIDHPVVVCNPRGIYSDHISHHIMMFVLALSRGLPYFADAQRAGRWDKQARRSHYVYLPDATALISGVGRVGTETARLCSEFGMAVVGVDPRLSPEAIQVEVHSPAELDGLLPRADFVIVTTPHTPQTEGMWDARRFRLMKRTAYFINVGRGKTTRLEDLTDAVEGGVIAGCGLDVFENEPLPSDHRLWRLPNVLLTPHIATRGAENLPERRYQVILENARRFAAGLPLVNVVDKAAWY